MNFLIMTGPLYPGPGNNVNLISKLFASLKQRCTLQLVSTIKKELKPKLSQCYFEMPVHWCFDDRSGAHQKIVYPLVSRLIDRNGFSDYISAKLLSDSVKEYQSRYPCDAIITTMEPFPAADAASRIQGVTRILYLMDPPAVISHGKRTAYRDRRLKRILAAQDLILTTPFIRAALIKSGFEKYDPKISCVGFPLIEPHNILPNKQTDECIRLLFCGWLYSDIRSPKYFLDIVSRLDERFEVTFMGKECELLQERFPIQTKAKLVTLPNQPYETALQAMADADIMINIGNSVPVHMPSKTLEYINTGMPFVNFYKMDDCPTLYYTKRYPLCLNLSENDPDVDSAAERFIDFCIANKGKTVDREYIEREYEDCTPEYIAQKILDALGE